jgi:hypothetical protein
MLVKDWAEPDRQFVRLVNRHDFLGAGKQEVDLFHRGLGDGMSVAGS